MVYKGAKWLCFLSIGDYLGGETYDPTKLRSQGRSPAAYLADKAGAKTSAKASALGGRSAYSVAQTAASLTNQAGGNIGFTYE